MNKSSPTQNFLDRLFDIKADFRPFNQKNDIFNRAIWDKKIDPKHFFASYDNTNEAPRKARGFNHWDYALRNASWHI